MHAKICKVLYMRYKHNCVRAWRLVIIISNSTSSQFGPHYYSTRIANSIEFILTGSQGLLQCITPVLPDKQEGKVIWFLRIITILIRPELYYLTTTPTQDKRFLRESVAYSYFTMHSKRENFPFRYVLRQVVIVSSVI